MFHVEQKSGMGSRGYRKRQYSNKKQWDRARGWALWKALYVLSNIKIEFNSEAAKQKQIITDVLSE